MFHLDDLGLIPDFFFNHKKGGVKWDPYISYKS